MVAVDDLKNGWTAHLSQARLTPSISISSRVSRSPAVSFKTTGYPPMFMALSMMSFEEPQKGLSACSGFCKAVKLAYSSGTGNR